MEIRDWLNETKASDIMLRDVVTLSPNDPLSKAASVLLHAQITGAPVLDEQGACVGVLSASDVLNAEEFVSREQNEIAESSFWNSNLALPASVYSAKLAEVRDKLMPASEQPVSRFMTSSLVNVAPDTNLKTIVRYMVDAHIHRVVVLDADSELVGIISTTDVLAALMRRGDSPE